MEKCVRQVLSLILSFFLSFFLFLIHTYIYIYIYIYTTIYLYIHVCMFMYVYMVCVQTSAAQAGRELGRFYDGYKTELYITREQFMNNLDNALRTSPALDALFMELMAIRKDTMECSSLAPTLFGDTAVERAQGVRIFIYIYMLFFLLMEHVCMYILIYIW